MLKEFKEFALKGNVIDLAVGIIIGGAFGKIVSSLVNDLIMPLMGYITAGTDFTSLKIVLSKAVIEGTEVIKPEASIMYGNFLQTLLDFLIIAFSIFIAIRMINKVRRKQSDSSEEPVTEPPAPTEAELLVEIRDILKNR